MLTEIYMDNLYIDMNPLNQKSKIEDSDVCYFLVFSIMRHFYKTLEAKHY